MWLQFFHNCITKLSRMSPTGKRKRASIWKHRCFVPVPKPFTCSTSFNHISNEWGKIVPRHFHMAAKSPQYIRGRLYFGSSSISNLMIRPYKQKICLALLQNWGDIFSLDYVRAMRGGGGAKLSPLIFAIKSSFLAL